jgi:CBS domain-containing protein
MTCARDVMTRPVICVRFDASIADAAQLMVQHGINGIPVLDASGKLVGIVTARDLLRGRKPTEDTKRPRWPEFLIALDRLPRERREFEVRKVADVMTPGPTTINDDAPLQKIARLMQERQIKRLPVLQAGELVGIIARQDLVRALAQGLFKPPPSEDEARRARMLELEKNFWRHRGARPSNWRQTVQLVSDRITAAR